MAANAKALAPASSYSTGVLWTDRRDFYIAPQVIKELWTDVTPFTTVIANRGTKSGLKDPQFKFFEHRNPWENQYFTTSSATTIASDDGADTIAVTSGSVVGMEGAGGDYAYNSWIGLELEVWDSSQTTNRGVLVITAVSSSGASANLSVKNAGASSITTVSGDYLRVIGNAQGEGTRSATAWADELTMIWNQCQIFKTAVEITGTLLEAALRGEKNELSRLRDQKNMEHKIQKEKAFLFGRSNMNLTGTFADMTLTDANSKNIRTTMGIIPGIEQHGASSGDDQNIFTINEASYDYANFVDDMEKVFQYFPESGMKRAFAGPGAMSYWSKMASTAGMAAKSGWTVNLSDMKRDHLGFNYKILETPHGILQLIPTPALRDAYNKYMLVVSDENLQHVQYRAPKFQASIQENDADYVKDQYFSDEGVGIQLIESHKLFKIK